MLKNIWKSKVSAMLSSKQNDVHNYKTKIIAF